MVSEDVESLLKDYNKLRDELRKCESQLADFRENERAIQQTIMTTQKVSDDLKRNAQRESDLILSEAKVAAEKFINDARTHAEKMMGGSRMEIEKLRKEFNDVKNKKLECELALRSMLESHLRLLKTETARKE